MHLLKKKLYSRFRMKDIFKKDDDDEQKEEKKTAELVSFASLVCTRHLFFKIKHINYFVVSLCQ